jgi:hypothetical protein
MEENISEQRSQMYELKSDFVKLQEEFGKFLLLLNKTQILVSDALPDTPITGPRAISWSTKRAELEKKYSSNSRSTVIVNGPEDIFKDK